MEENKGLFEVDGAFYTLKFNMQKVKQIETALGISFVAEIGKTQGLISFTLLESLFALGLYDVKDEKAVKGKKAQGIYEALLQDVGYQPIVEIVNAKLEEDLGFLFQ